MIGNFKTVCICGSSKFKNEIEHAAKHLYLLGNVVLKMHAYGHSGDDEAWAIKPMLEEMYSDMIAFADFIFVVNKDGYIGESTRNEINLAKKLNKPITYLENVDNGHGKYCACDSCLKKIANYVKKTIS